MPVVRIPAALKYYVENRCEIEFSASTMTDLLNLLVASYPSLRVHLLDDDGRLRRHFNVFINGVHIRELSGLDTVLHPDDKVLLLASAAGG
jgi:molybdopterin converting factor small subunit